MPNTRKDLKHGVPVPEADRDVYKGRIYHEKKRAIAAIPIIDEDGKKVEALEANLPLVYPLNSLPELSASKFVKS